MKKIKIKNKEENISKVCYAYTVLFKGSYEYIQKNINNLSDERLIYHNCISWELVNYLNKNQTKLEEQNSLSDKEIKEFIEDLKKQIEWCEKQFTFRNEIRKKHRMDSFDYKKASQDSLKLINKEIKERL